MLLIAVCAPVGGGKSTVLTELAVRLLDRGKQLEGFVQIALERSPECTGALRYELLRFPNMDRIPWAERDETLTPPYRFDAVSEQALRHWSAGLGPESVQIAILDEFGKLEIGGHGHLHVWVRLSQISPNVVVIGVRDENVEALEQRFGQRFDLVVDAREPNVVSRLEALCAEARDWEAVGVYGAGAGALEVSLGSAIHAAQIPMGGLGMAALQAQVLSSAAEGLARRDRVGWVALVAAGLKALSPAGSRLRPMLAISVQGSLFALSVRLLGWNRLAVFVGGALVGGWAAGQGLVLQWILVGRDFERAYDAALRWIAKQLGVAAPGLPFVLGGLVLISAIVIGTLTAAFWTRRHAGTAKFTRLHARPPRSTDPNLHPLLATLREMAHPSFWFPIAVILALLLLSGSRWQDAVLTSIRALAIALVLFGGVKLLKVEQLGSLLQRLGLYGPAAAVTRAFRRP